MGISSKTNTTIGIGLIHIYIRVSDPHFFADPGENFHADPDPGGIRGRGVVKEKNKKKLSFFHVSDDS